MLPYSYQSMVEMMRKAKSPRGESKRQWISGLAITITALVCLFGFSKLAPSTTFVVALGAFVALVVIFWIAGKPDDGSNRPEG